MTMNSRLSALFGAALVFTLGVAACSSDDDESPAPSGATGGSAGTSAGSGGSGVTAGSGGDGGAGGDAGGGQAGSAPSSCQDWNVGNPSCKACVQQSCCDVATTCLANPDCDALKTCIATNMCTDNTCLMMCNTQNMAGSADFQQVWGCMGMHCATECSKP
jgi:hypothetical protein